MNKKRKKGSIIALVLLIIILISGGFLIFYLFFSNYKDIIKKEKSIFISYELNKGNQLVDDKKRIINSYSNYEDDDVKISINKNNIVEIKYKELNKKYIVDEITNAKSFIYYASPKFEMHILDDSGEIYYLNIGNYTNVGDSYNFRNISNDYFKFDTIYMVKYFKQGNYENGFVKIFYKPIGLGDNGKYYELLDSGVRLLDYNTLDKNVDDINKNIVGFIGDENFGYMLNNKGNLLLLKENEFLPNKIKFEDDSNSKIYKMFVYDNGREYDLYVLNDLNKLYTSSVSKYLSISDNVLFSEVKQNLKVQTIQYELPKKYLKQLETNNSFNFENLTFIFSDNSKLIIDSIDYTNTFNILESE